MRTTYHSFTLPGHLPHRRCCCWCTILVASNLNCDCGHRHRHSLLLPYPTPLMSPNFPTCPEGSALVLSGGLSAKSTSNMGRHIEKKWYLSSQLSVKLVMPRKTPTASNCSSGTQPVSALRLVPEPLPAFGRLSGRRMP